MRRKNVPHLIAVTIILVSAGSIGLYEWRQLSALDHPPLRKIDCTSCHSDAKTLKAMKDKRGDD